MKRLITIFLIALLAIPGTFAVSSPVQTQQNPQQITPLAVGDTVNGEKVVWVSPNIGSLGENDVAYLTAIDILQTATGTLDECFFSTFDWYRVVARNQWFIKQFEVNEISNFYFHWYVGEGWECTSTQNSGSYQHIWNSYWSKKGGLQYTGTHSGNLGTGKARQDYKSFWTGNEGFVWAKTYCYAYGYKNYDWDWSADYYAHT